MAKLSSVLGSLGGDGLHLHSVCVTFGDVLSFKAVRPWLPYISPVIAPQDAVPARVVLHAKSTATPTSHPSLIYMATHTVSSAVPKLL
jgi:hypothetical protein